MKNSINNKDFNSLCEVFLSLRNAGDLQLFLRDLCTRQELQEMSERWAIAKLLDKKQTYRAIATKLKVSTTTVSRVASWLNAGKGGYRIALNNSNHHNSSPNFKKS